MNDYERKQHLLANEPKGHELDAHYFRVVKLSGVSLEQEHTFQHKRDKRAGIRTHEHDVL